MNRFNWQRAVIKVGSALIAPEGNECSGRYLLSLARFITASREAGKEIILVSSGSVAAEPQQSGRFVTTHLLQKSKPWLRLARI